MLHLQRILQTYHSLFFEPLNFVSRILVPGGAQCGSLLPFLSLNENSDNEVIRIEAQGRLLSAPPVLIRFLFMPHMALKAAENATTVGKVR